MNRIYLVRHGENTANVTHEFSCKRVDYSLTPKGLVQAQQTAEFFRRKGIHEVFASPLKRARETAEAIARPIALPVTIIEHFREVNVGSFEGMEPTPENWQRHDHYFKRWFEGDHEATFPDGENYLSLINRMRSGLLEATRNKSDRNIVVVAHGGIFLASVPAICSNITLKQLVQQPNHNCAITEIELETNDPELTGRLISWASHAHLSGEAAQFAVGSPASEAKASARS